MQDLRLIGVHEDGAHLLLAGADGVRYRLPLDDALRAAARRDRPRLGQLQIEIEGGARPREVQAMIRAGLSSAEVAERSGWSLEKIGKYEGPILAEREHVAGLARAVRIRHRGSGSVGAPTLERRVAERLATRGVEPEHLSWDSWRREGPEWTVVVTFPAGGRERQASWSLDVPTRTLTPRDDEARWLSEDEVAPAVVRDAPVYDVEADGGVDATSVAARPDRPLDLVTAMRERSGARGRRSGTRRRLQPVALPLDEEPEPTADVPADRGDRPTRRDRRDRPVRLPAEADTDVDTDVDTDAVADGGSDPGAHPVPARLPAPRDDPAPEADADPAGGARADYTPDEPPHAGPADGRDADGATDGGGLRADLEADLEDDLGEETGDADAGASARHTESATDPATEPTTPRPPTRRTARTPVPSWDDIVFGATSRPARDED